VVVAVSALAFLAASLLVVSILYPRRAPEPRRVEAYLLSAEEAASLRGLPQSDFGERVVSPALAWLGKVSGKLTPAGVAKKLRGKLDMAGNPRFPTFIEYLGLRLLSPATVIPLGLIGLAQLELDWALWVTALGVVIGIGIWLPDIVLQRVIDARQAAIRRALPDAVDLLVVSVEAGVGLEGAMQQVVRRGRGPLADELSRVLEQVRLGRSRADALREMGQRTQVPELTAFVAAIQQAEALGVSIAKVLRTQADAVRKRRSERAREVAAKLPVKLLFPLVFCIFPALFVVILGPAAIRFAELFRVLGK
jgi:tight adherence protein C